MSYDESLLGRAGWQYVGMSGDGRSDVYQDRRSYYWRLGRGRAVDIMPDLSPWLRSARHNANRYLRPLVQPYPRPLDHLVDFAPDDDLIVGRDGRRLHWGKHGAVSQDLSRMHLHFATWSGSEETSLHGHISPATWDRITECVRSWREAEDD